MVQEGNFSFIPLSILWFLGYLWWVVFTDTTFGLVIFIIPLIVLGLLDVSLLYIGTRTLLNRRKGDETGEKHV